MATIRNAASITNLATIKDFMVPTPLRLLNIFPSQCKLKLKFLF